jgi:hypothetical protein
MDYGLYINFIFPSNTTIYQLTHMPLCIIELIGPTMPLNVTGDTLKSKKSTDIPVTGR